MRCETDGTLCDSLFPPRYRTSMWYGISCRIHALTCILHTDRKPYDIRFRINPWLRTIRISVHSKKAITKHSKLLFIPCSVTYTSLHLSTMEFYMWGYNIVHTVAHTNILLLYILQKRLFVTRIRYGVFWFRNSERTIYIPILDKTKKT